MSTPHTNTSGFSRRPSRAAWSTGVAPAVAFAVSLAVPLAVALAVALVAGPVAAQQGGAPQEPAAAPASDEPPMTPALAAAEAGLAEARRVKEAAYGTLEAMVTELADDYAALTSGPDAAAHLHALVLALTDSLPTAQARLASEVAKGRAVQRGTRRQLLHDAF
ncbi:MAG TPA: hypothetical protein VK824_11960, partial [Planctomycetota bacterium]|nr:hypothetical protein [Planctomycetota bacterium]